MTQNVEKTQQPGSEITEYRRLVEQTTNDSSPNIIARLVAFGFIILTGFGTGLAGYATGELTMTAPWIQLATAIGALVGAGGAGLVSYLALQAMIEWDTSDVRSAP